jgi:cell division septation protein DedD
MSILDDELREEERAGFEPGDDFDESFLSSESKEHPVKAEEFSLSEDKPIDSPEPEKISSETPSNIETGKPLEQPKNFSDYQRTKKKDRKRFPLLWIAVAVAALVTLLIFGTVVYILYLKPVFERKHMQQVVKTEIKKKDKTVYIEEPKQTKDNQISGKVNEKNEPNTIAENKEPEIKTKTDIQPKTAFVEPKKQTTPEVKKTRPQIAYNTNPANVIKPVAANTKQTPKSLIETKQNLFTVQIYSSLSRDDAEEWLNRLKRKNVAGGFISSQKVRDKIFYRVRFGPFDSREEAEAEASKLGFAEIWIDRIR